MKPEEKAELIIWDWLKNYSFKVVEVYFNRVNEAHAPVFTTTGINKKPDFIIKLQDSWGIKYYAIEVKSCEKSKNVLNASKILDKYLKHYLNNETKYFINDKEIRLRGFLIATENSKLGYLFKFERFIDNSNIEDGESKYQAATKYRIIPTKEGSRTFEFIRFLWEIYGKFRNDYDNKLDVGILIGNTEMEFKPYMMITSYYLKTNRWSQRWWAI